MQIGKYPAKEEAKRREQLHKLIVACSDIRLAQTTARYLIDNVSSEYDPLGLTLQEVVIVSYARPFTDNRPLGALPAKWGRFSDARMQDLHNKIIAARHQSVAHSDHAIRKVTITPKGNRLPFPQGLRARTTAWEITNRKFQSDTFPEIELLCSDLGSRLYADVKKRLEELFPSSDTPGSPFDLLPELGDTDPIPL